MIETSEIIEKVEYLRNNVPHVGGSLDNIKEYGMKFAWGAECPRCKMLSRMYTEDPDTFKILENIMKITT